MCAGFPARAQGQLNYRQQGERRGGASRWRASHPPALRHAAHPPLKYDPRATPPALVLRRPCRPQRALCGGRQQPWAAQLAGQRAAQQPAHPATPRLPHPHIRRHNRHSPKFPALLHTTTRRRGRYAPRQSASIPFTACNGRRDHHRPCTCRLKLFPVRVPHWAARRSARCCARGG